MTYQDIANRLKQNGVNAYLKIDGSYIGHSSYPYGNYHELAFAVGVYCPAILLEKRKQEIQLLLSDMPVKIDLDKNKEEITIELLK